MSAYQSVPEFALSEQYHRKAVCCEKCAERASDQTTEQEWQELATQLHSMADQAANMSDDASWDGRE
jgi:predicted HAD superfamily Cof-like phosphohydrolase